MKVFVKKNGAFVFSGLLATIIMTGGVLLSPTATLSARAQAGASGKALPPITLDLRDAPVRQALEQLFNNAKVDFSIANEVQGFVTLKITDQPFENALRLILRSSSIPLTFVREGDVYIVKPRIAETVTGINETPPPFVDPNLGNPPVANYDVIQLTYIDPADLANTLGITFIRSFTRQGNGQQGGQQGGLGGLNGGNGFSGGLGGLNGGSIGGANGGIGGSMGFGNGNNNNSVGFGNFGGGRGF